MGTAVKLVLWLLLQFGVPGHHNVLITWQASPTQDVYLYNVYRGTQTGGPYTYIGNTSGLSFVDSNVSDGTTYYWVVTAVGAAWGESVYSPEAICTTGT